MSLSADAIKIPNGAKECFNQRYTKDVISRKRHIFTYVFNVFYELRLSQRSCVNKCLAVYRIILFNIYIHIYIYIYFLEII